MKLVQNILVFVKAFPISASFETLKASFAVGLCKLSHRDASMNQDVPSFFGDIMVNGTAIVHG